MLPSVVSPASLATTSLSLARSLFPRSPSWDGVVLQVVHLYEELQSSGMKPTPITYTALFSAAARNKHRDMAWLLQVP